ncbi:hypothetical protein K402DRAFT_242203 [Aulographum hederae CBS 113979]|uniref:LIM zinc-binding domain-containing protein n=1 Tax=Aulographum hederae CBS 113979 TaxID=1176131 RepID=A0A6G1H9K0_9PEZI|nr:hypothetical protein K402DRAFT_242203 [Aulographum hederae CBS 113979]
MSRPDSLLPTIKCSTCGVDIDLSALADHVCSATPVPSKILQRDVEPTNPPSSKPTRFNPPSRIDSGIANRPFLSQNTPTSSNYSGARTPSPLTPSGRQSPGAALRRPNANRIYAPPSPEAVSLDNPYPPFPSAEPNPPRYRNNSRPATPQNEAPRKTESPPKPVPEPGSGLLQRMNTVVPGFFRSKTEPTKLEPPPVPDTATDPASTTLKRAATEGSVRDRLMKGSAPAPAPASDKSTLRKGGSVSSQWSRTSDVANEGGPRRYGRDSPDVKTGAPSRPSRPSEAVDRFLEQLQSDGEMAQPLPSLSESASRSNHRRNESSVGTIKQAPVRPRRPSDPLSPAMPPSESQPDDDTPRYGRQRSQTQSSRKAPPNINNTSTDRTRNDPRLFDAPPVPPPSSFMQQQFPGISTHSPTSSASSEASAYSSDARSQSSRSSPPESEASGWSRRPSLSSTMSPAVDNFSPVEPSYSYRTQTTEPSSRSRTRELTNTTVRTDPAMQRGPESPVDPAIQAGIFSPPLTGPKKGKDPSMRKLNPLNILPLPASYGSPSLSSKSSAGRSMRSDGSNSSHPQGPFKIARPPGMQAVKESTEWPLNEVRPSNPQRPIPEFTYSPDEESEPYVPIVEPYTPKSEPYTPRTEPREKSDRPKPVVPAVPARNPNRSPTMDKYVDPAISVAPKPVPAPRERLAVSKGKCRGCEKDIYGKSVKAADGRLTGRWHKECFVCRTCAIPFPDGSFYFHGNHPYCAHHYHTLNNTLCRSCTSGIEGPYLETDDGNKYHSHCFTCMRCSTVLEHDYLEVEGKQYCERHAYQMTMSKSSLGPGRRNMERRTTRLMMI